MLDGLHKFTGGKCQDWVFFLLNVVSFFLVFLQVNLNLATEFQKHGENPCKKAFPLSAKDVWFMGQLVLNAFATLAQAFLWVAQVVNSIRFWCKWGVFPATRHENPGETNDMYRALQLDKYCLENYTCVWHELDIEDQQEALEEFYHEDHIGAQEEELDEMRYEFQRDIHLLCKLGSFQKWVTAFRNWVGVLGAIIEPMLMATVESGQKGEAQSGDNLFSQLKKIYTFAPLDDVSKSLTTTPSAMFNSTKAALSEAENGEECLELHSISAAVSGMVAAVGFWQATMKTSYTRLIRLVDLKDQKLKDITSRTSGQGDQQDSESRRAATRTQEYAEYESEFEAAAEATLGPDGKRFVLLLGGQDVQ